MEKKYPHLFSPITLAGQIFKNRIFGAPTGFVDQDKEGMYPPEAAVYFTRKAMGGAASVTLGGLAVDMDYGVGYGYNVRLDNMFSGDPYPFHGITRVAESVSRYGCVCCGELQHAGMYANRWKDPPGVAFGPVDGVDRDGRVYREMPEEIIERTIEKYAKAAGYLKKCGFGMVMVHAGHGWMLHQFMSPKINTRHDKWGGPDIENRARFTVAILDAIRREVGPAFPIEVRISGSECYDGGYGLDEGIAFAKQLDGHCDLIHVSCGSHEVDKVFTDTHPSMFHADGCNVKYAAEIKKHVNTSIATVGALTDPALMEEIIASGKADVVELARGLLADPDLPNKARAGREDEINKCLRCLACFSNLMQTGHFRCAINPKLGWESEMQNEVGPVHPKKVLIAGGGIAGMQAAITCREQGHQVILCEKSGQLGGALKCEENVSFKKLIKEYIERQTKAVYDSGAEVRLNTAVTPELADSIGADVIISAMGAEPVMLKIPGIDRDNVFSGDDAYTYPDKVGRNVVILGAGLVGLELAIYLTMEGRNVTVVEMTGKVSDGGNYQHMKGVMRQIDDLGIEINFNTKALAIDDSGVLCRHGGEDKHIACDTVICAAGRRALKDEAFALAYCAPEFYPVGDCIVPQNIMTATSMAYTAARDAGRL